MTIIKWPPRDMVAEREYGEEEEEYPVTGQKCRECGKPVDRVEICDEWPQRCPYTVRG